MILRLGVEIYYKGGQIVKRTRPHPTESEPIKI